MRPLISVVIPTHNRARLLGEALESVFAQQGSGVEFDMEVIVVDDASSDNTSEIITNHPGVRYVRLPANRGLAAARNVGVRVSSGEYVAFLDDDDTWLPRKLRQQFTALETDPAAAAVYSPCIVRAQGREKVIPERGRAPFGFVLNSLVKGNLAPVHGYLLRRSAIERAGYFDEQLSCLEDWDLWLRIALHSPFIFLPGCVGVYRSSPLGLHGTAVANGNEALAHRRMMEKLRPLLGDSTAPPEIAQEARAWVELELARYLMTEQVTSAQSHLLAALRIFPDLIHEAQTRQKIASIVSRMACPSAAPFNFTRTLNIEMRRTIRRAGIGQQIAIARLFSCVWARVAWRLSFRPDASDRAPGKAAGLALRTRESAEPKGVNRRETGMYSVIVPTFNRVSVSTLAVESLLAQDTALSYEIIVVDNNSTDDTRQRMLALEKHAPERVRYVFEREQGLSSARNAGVAAARGDVIAFMDDDAIAQPGWLNALGHAYETRPDAWCVGGKIVLKLPDVLPSWFNRRSMFLMSNLSGLDLGDGTIECEEPHDVWGCNFSVRRDVFDRIGLFDLALGLAGRRRTEAEEVEFCRRIRRAGGKVYYCGGAVVTHLVLPARMTKRFFRGRMYWRGRTLALVRGKDAVARTGLFVGLPEQLARTWIHMAVNWMKSWLFPGSVDRHRIFEDELAFWDRLGYLHQAVLMSPSLLASRCGQARRTSGPGSWIER